MEQMPAGDPNVISPSNAKDPILILVVGLFLGGVAYFVVGQWQKGLAAVAVWLCAIALVFVTCGLGIFLYFPLVITMVIDSYLQAKALKDGHSIGHWTFFTNHL